MENRIRKERHKRIRKEDIDLLGYERLTMKVLVQIAKTHGQWVFDYRESLEQESMIGLIKAWHAYDPTRGTFVTIAYLKIHNEMTRFINKKARAYVCMNNLEDIKFGYVQGGTAKMTWQDLFPGNHVDYFDVARLAIKPDEEDMWKLFKGLCSGVLKVSMHKYVGVTKDELAIMTEELRERMVAVVLELYGESHLYS